MPKTIACPHCGKEVALPARAKRESPISFDGRRFAGVTTDDLADWRKTYPAIDVPGEILKLEAWARANPANRKSNWLRFIVNNLSRAQDRAPGRGASVQAVGPSKHRWWDTWAAVLSQGALLGVDPYTPETNPRDYLWRVADARRRAGQMSDRELAEIEEEKPRRSAA